MFEISPGAAARWPVVIHLALLGVLAGCSQVDGVDAPADQGWIGVDGALSDQGIGALDAGVSVDLGSSASDGGSADLAPVDVGGSDLGHDAGPTDAGQDSGPVLDPDYPNDFRIIMHNMFLLGGVVEPDTGQSARAGFLAEAEFLRGYDVVIMNELFIESAIDTVLGGLSAEYPHQTPVLGESRTDPAWDETLGSYSSLTVESGGVVIASKWPIERMVQFIFSDGCGGEALANKGFIYVRIRKDGMPYHVIGTHTQSTQSICEAPGPAGVRAIQFREIYEFIRDENIPTDEVVYIGGDMNVIGGTPEYDSMLSALHAASPRLLGMPGSWDPETNTLARRAYPEYGAQLLDYVFVSADHAQPDEWHNIVTDPVSPAYTLDGTSYYEYSDHYPVVAIPYADETTPVRSERGLLTSYEGVRLRNLATDAYVRLDGDANDGYLQLEPLGTDGLGDWIIQAFPERLRTGCLRSGDYVSISGMSRPGYFWNWWGTNYLYYTKQNDESNNLHVVLESGGTGCIQDGDIVGFRDDYVGTDYYLEARTGSSPPRVGLFGTGFDDASRFEVEMAPLRYREWGDQLVYR